MAFGKRSVISDNLNDYSVMLCGESGIGKTTVMSELCEKEFGEEGYLLLNTGSEEGVSAIDGVTYEDVPDFKTFVLICNDIIKNKKTDYPNLKVILIDTLDQLVDIAEKAAIAKWNQENMGTKNFKPAKSINPIEGGFGAGYGVVFNMIYDKIRALESVGVRTWYCAHVKNKDIVDPLSNASYTTISSNIAQKYFNEFKTKVHVVGMAVLDRTIETEETGRKDIHKNDITVNKITNERRKIVFRDDSYSVDSKSRFAGIVNEIPLGSDELRQALHDAIKNSKKSSFTKKENLTVNPVPVAVEDTDLEESNNSEIENIEEEAEPFVPIPENENLEEDEETPFEEDELPVDVEVLRNQFKTMFVKIKGTELYNTIKTEIKKSGVAKISDLDAKTLQKLIGMLQ